MNKIIINNISNTTKYLNKMSKKLIEADFPLEKLEIKSIEGLQSDISLFQGVSMSEIKFLSKWFENLNLARGCKNDCLHCLRDAKKPLVQNQNSINTLLWNDFERFVQGFSTLNERIGANVLEGNKYSAFFDDFNPPDFKSFDLNGNVHNFAEAVKLFFDKLKIPTAFVTAGWNKADKASQKAAAELSDLFKKAPDAFSSIEVSINPFHRLLTQSEKLTQQAKPEQALMLRQAYTDNLANTLNTFLSMFEGKNPKAKIIYRHANDFTKGTSFDEAATAKLYQDIFEKLQKISNGSVEKIEALRPEIVTEFKPSHLIDPKGRGRKFFSAEDNFKKQQELIDEKMYFESLPESEKNSQIYNFAAKGVDINGKVYATNPSETTIGTNIQLNYINKSQKTAPIFSDIELEKLAKF